MAITQNHVINIQPGVSAPLVIHCSQGDTGTQINLTVVNGDEEFDCSSYACSVHGVRSDGANWGPFPVTVSGSTVSFPLRSAMTAIAGPCLAEISVGTVGTANFAILVENATFSLGVTYTEDISVYQSILSYNMGAVQNINAKCDAAIDQMDANTNAINAKCDAAIDQMDANTNAINAKCDAAIDQMDANTNAINAKYDAAITNFNQAISTTQNQYAVTNAKLDTAISAVTQDSEVQDIRVKADGTSAATAGNAVREQITELKNDLANKTDNKYGGTESSSFITLTNQKAFDPTTGSSYTRSNRAASAQIEKTPDMSKITCASGYFMALMANDLGEGNPMQIFGSMWVSSVDLSEVNYKHLFVVIKKSDDTDFADGTTSDIISIYKYSGIVPYLTDEDIEEFKSDVSELKSDVSELKSDVSELKNIPVTCESQKIYLVTNGVVTVKTGKNYYTFHSAIISVNSRTTAYYYYTGRMYNYKDQYSLIAIDDNNNALAYELDYSTDTQVNEYKFVIPSKATKLIVQSYKNDPVLKTEEVINFEKLKSDVSELKSDVPKKTNNDKVMRSICRMGEAYGQPESVAAIKACHDAGYNIVRVNLQYTSDGVAVLWHDPYVNQYYKDVYDSNNKLVPYSDDDRIGIAETPVATLDLYKWGGTSYAAGIVRAESVIAATRKLGMELYLECKQSLSDTQIADILSLIRKYGMTDRTSFATASRTAALAIATQEPRVRIGYTDSKFTSALQNDYLALKAVTNNLFWWGWSTLIPTKEMVEFLNANGIKYECGDFSSFNDITTYLNNQYAWYCTGMELSSDLGLSPLLGQYIENNI